MNQFNGIGNLTRDPETSVTQGGVDSCRFSIAINRPKDPNGVTEADFIPCRAYGKRANVISQYCRKGTKLGITGRMRTYTYSDKETGAKKSGFEILVDDFTFLPSSNPNRSEFGEAHSDMYGATHHDLNSPNDPNAFTVVENEELPF